MNYDNEKYTLSDIQCFVKQSMFADFELYIFAFLKNYDWWAKSLKRTAKKAIIILIKKHVVCESATNNSTIYLS